MPLLNRHQVGQAGEHLVAAELHRRGAYAVTFSGNMPDIDVLARDVAQRRHVEIQVKTKTSGTWHTNTTRARKRSRPDHETRFWILVDIGKNPHAHPAYFVVPEWWIQNYIHEGVEEYRRRHGDDHPRTSKHWAIKPSDVETWRERWNLLEVCDDVPEASARQLDPFAIEALQSLVEAEPLVNAIAEVRLVQDVWLLRWFGEWIAARSLAEPQNILLVEGIAQQPIFQAWHNGATVRDITIEVDPAAIRRWAPPDEMATETSGDEDCPALDGGCCANGGRPVRLRRSGDGSELSAG